MTTSTKDKKAPIRYFAPNTGIEKCPGCGNIPQGAGWRITVPGKWYSWHAECFEKAKEEKTDRTREASRHQPETCSLCSEEHAEGTCLL